MHNFRAPLAGGGEAHFRLQCHSRFALRVNHRRLAGLLGHAAVVDQFNHPAGAGAIDLGLDRVAEDFHRQEFARQSRQAFVGNGRRPAGGGVAPGLVTLNGGATFSIVLRDAAGFEVRVSSSAQGEAVNRPYQRTGDGTGTGWQNELRTIRLRLRDFQSGGTGINLAQIVAVRIEVGGTAGSAIGRFILDDLQFTKE